MRPAGADADRRGRGGEGDTAAGFWRSYVVSRFAGMEMRAQAAGNGERDKSFWSWGEVQAAARIEAGLYSLRILRQVLRYLVTVKTALPHLIIELHQKLVSLPPLKVMMGTRLERFQRGESGF